MEPSEDTCGVNLISLLQSGKFSDLQLSCQGGDFAVHKAILCAQSRVISAECEGNFEEATTNVIKIEEFKAETVQTMLEFLYSGDYSVSPRIDPSFDNSIKALDSSLEYEHDSQTLGIEKLFDLAASTKQNRLCWHLHANAIGDYYDIQPLCRLARTKVMEELEEDWRADDFLHLLTETCTTRRTGDIEFHRLLGNIAAEHLDDLVGLKELDNLDMPAAVSMTLVVSSIEQVRFLEKEIQDKADTINSLMGRINRITWKQPERRRTNSFGGPSP